VSQMDRERQPLLRDRDPVLGIEAPADLIEVQHSDVREQLSEYFDGSLEARDAARVRYHLERCAACRAFAHTLDRTISETRQLPMHHLPDARKRALLARLNGTT
jgi:anti-sigma factor RsiW